MDAATSDELIVVLPRQRLPLRFVAEGGSVFLLGRDNSAEWPVLLLRDGFARLEVGSAQSVASVRLVADPVERERIFGEFRARYGAERFARWFPAPGRMLRLDLTTTPSGTPNPYERWVAAEFDAIAPDYAIRIRDNPIERWARECSRRFLISRLEGRSHLLEIGPGLGIETLPLLQAGHSVTAVDVSAEMLVRLEQRAGADGVAGRLRTVRMAAHDLNRLPTVIGPQKFDGVYSTFGALNCEPDLAPVATSLRALLVDGAPAIVGVFNRFSIGEMFAGLVSLDPARGLSRLQSRVPVGSSRFSVDYYPRSVRDLREAFGPSFHLEETLGFPVVLPPADRVRRLRATLERFPGLLAADERLGSASVLANLADHVWTRFTYHD